MKVPSAIAALARPRWWRTGNACFPLTARMFGSWWVLRVNGFPDHPLYTLFVDQVGQGDLDDLPRRWGKPDSVAGPQLEGADQLAVLDGLDKFEVYGSERGEPCQGLYCCGWE
ncbi:hypothetical protein ABIE44_000162 [Marmoricola sp. OAE513]|uniref:hypothetical protein n=1 Tax=Marmoricola sp. OAE513 TaxID=2817894 RepID=UPI001AE915F5